MRETARQAECAGSEQRPPGIQHVCACVDRSPAGERLLPHAVALARAFDARLTVLHVLEPPHQDPEATPIDPLDWEIQRAEARRHVAAVGSEQAATGIRVDGEILEGRPAEEICDWVRSHGVDVTALATHGASGCTDWSLASTARKLVEGVSGAVLLVPARSREQPLEATVTYTRILCLLDGSSRAESALPVALKLAQAGGAELLLLHVVQGPQQACPCPLEPDEQALDQRLLDRNLRAADFYLANVRGRLEGAGVRTRSLVIVDGNVRDEALRRIGANHVDLVVLSGHGRGGNPKLPFGSVTSYLLEHATAPLLVVREPTTHPPRARQGDNVRGRVPLPNHRSS